MTVSALRSLGIISIGAGALFHGAPRRAAVSSSAQPSIARARLPLESGGFVMTLGSDTVQVEQFARNGDSVTGVIAVRTPKAKLIHYAIRLGERNRWLSYEQHTTAADGTALADPGIVRFTYVGDTIVRIASQRGQPVEHRVFAPDGGYPLSTIPIGNSFLVYEFALAAARTSRVTAPSGLLMVYPLAVAQKEPSHIATVFASPDSVALDYFGQGSSRFRFDANGRLVRADWTNTTYKVIVTRQASIDATAIALAWSAQQLSGNGIGALSARDSVRVALDDATLSIAYGRPSKRGRTIWGGIVPWNSVWRLGADGATQFRTDKDLIVGGAAVPAGSYSIWMLPSPDGSLLVINKQANIFGTQYNPANDLVRVPLRMEEVQPATERLTIGIADGRLSIAWDRSRYSAPVARSTAPRPDSAARAVFQRMHDAYAGNWYRSLTFVQRTTTWDSVRVPQVETWYETLAQIDGRVVLRIDRGAPADGNGVLYTADSMWVMRLGKLAATRASGNAFFPVIEGVYVQPVDQTMRELRSTGVDLTQLQSTSWQGRAVMAIGASAPDDMTSPQIWIDPKRNVLVRMILRTSPARPPVDIHLDGYERVGKGWLATKVSMFANGVAQQVEEYSDWRADRSLSASLFSTDQWTTSPHWAKP